MQLKGCSVGAVFLTGKGRGDKGGEMGDHRRLDISQGMILVRGASLGRDTV